MEVIKNCPACPLCGKPCELAIFPDDDSPYDEYGIHCSVCEFGEWKYDSPQEAIEAHNALCRRTDKAEQLPPTWHNFVSSGAVEDIWKRANNAKYDGKKHACINDLRRFAFICLCDHMREIPAENEPEKEEEVVHRKGGCLGTYSKDVRLITCEICIASINEEVCQSEPKSPLNGNG